MQFSLGGRTLGKGIDASEQRGKGAGKPGKMPSGKQRPGKAASGKQRPGRASAGSQKPSKVASGKQRPGKAASGKQRPGKAPAGSQKSGGGGAGGVNPTASQGTGARQGTVAPANQRLLGGAWPGQRQRPPGTAATPPDDPIPTSIEQALKLLSERIHYPQSKDAVIRKFMVSCRPPARAFIAYYEGIADTARIEREVLRPLMGLSARLELPRRRVDSFVLNALLPAASAERKFTVGELIDGLVMGEAVVVIDGGSAFLADIKNPPARSPSKPLTERTVQGPQLAFTESHRTNTAMVRAFVHDPDLILERFTVGRRSRTPVSVMYLSDIANPELLAEVRRRLEAVDVDSVLDSATLETLIGDHPLSLVPTALTTERPDRVAFEVLQGAVGIIVGNSARNLVVPVTYAVFMHTAEDAYFPRWSFVSALRVVRLVATTISLLLPGLFVSVLDFHQEMIPVLLLAILKVFRATIPFPLILNLVFMELALELIREAGLRIPSAIGPTIGIVGALLLGDMAVRSGLVTPMIVIVVALTALASFSVPDPAVSFAVRLGRFVFIALAAVLGFYGLALGLFVLGIHMASLRSFGVPFLSPVGPWRPGSLDVILRGPNWTLEKRPIHYRPLDLIRQAKYSRAWDPGVPGSKGRANGNPNPERDERGGQT